VTEDPDLIVHLSLKFQRNKIKNTLIQTKKYLKLTSTKFPRFIFIDVFFNRQSAFLWAQLELLVYLFFYPYEHTSFGGFSMNINDEQFPSTSKNERIPIFSIYSEDEKNIVKHGLIK
jgi:hypothetical protein